MLLSTHIATGLLLAYVFDFYMVRICGNYAQNMLLRIAVYVFAPMIQVLMDAGGHEVGTYRGKTYYRRTPATHSLPAVFGIGLALGLPLAFVTGIRYMVHYFVSQLLLHWLEDLVTEGGVYIVRRRVRIASLSYRNALANRTTITLAVALTLLFTNPLADVITFTYFMAATTYAVYAFLKV